MIMTEYANISKPTPQNGWKINCMKNNYVDIDINSEE